MTWGLWGGFDSTADGLNNAGEAVGYSDLAGAEKTGNIDQHAFLFQGGQMLDLNNLVTNLPSNIYLYEAFDISDAGLITGTWHDNNLDGGSFLLVPNPVPESSTFFSLGLLLCLSLLLCPGKAIALWRRRASYAHSATGKS